MTAIKIALGLVAFLGLYALAGFAGDLLGKALSNIDPMFFLAVLTITVVVAVHKVARKYL